MAVDGTAWRATASTVSAGPRTLALHPRSPHACFATLKGAATRRREGGALVWLNVANPSRDELAGNSLLGADRVRDHAACSDVCEPVVGVLRDRSPATGSQTPDVGASTIRGRLERIQNTPPVGAPSGRRAAPTRRSTARN
jgi:hypothetical protein